MSPQDEEKRWILWFIINGECYWHIGDEDTARMAWARAGARYGALMEPTPEFDESAS